MWVQAASFIGDESTSHVVHYSWSINILQQTEQGSFLQSTSWLCTLCIDDSPLRTPH
jgi:hypothetical protein